MICHFLPSNVRVDLFHFHKLVFFFSSKGRRSGSFGFLGASGSTIHHLSSLTMEALPQAKGHEKLSLRTIAHR